MNSIDLVYFVAVARTGSITKAAMFLDTVQSNVTQRIKRLEEELGVGLFHRTGRGVTLSPAGAQLLPHAKRIEHMMDEARRSIINAAEPSGTLVVGAMETTAALRLPDVLVDFAQHYPDVDLILRTNTTASLVDDVLERRIEGAIIAGPVDHPDLIAERVGVETLVVVTAPWLRYAQAGRPAWLASSTEAKVAIFRNGCAYRERLERLLIRQGVTNIRRMEIGSLDGILGCVRAGIAISLLPQAVAAPWAASGDLAIHTLPPEQSNVESVFVRRRDTFASSALLRFIDKAKEHYKSERVGADEDEVPHAFAPAIQPVGLDIERERRE